MGYFPEFSQDDLDDTVTTAEMFFYMDLPPDDRPKLRCGHEMPPEVYEWRRVRGKWVRGPRIDAAE
jgi:hypothetical protein